MKTARAFALVASMAVGVGCATLGPIPEGTCGNGIVELGEDCERSGPGATCGAPGASGACRYTCDLETPDQTCPAGFGCGVDGICRAPSDDFESSPAITRDVEAIALTTGDFDGDRHVDLLARSNRRAQIFAVDDRSARDLVERTSLSLTQNILSSSAIGDRVVNGTLQNAMPAVGAFVPSGTDAARRASLAVLRPGGFVSLWEGHEDGTLEPKVFSAFGDESRFMLGTGEVIPATSQKDATAFGREVLVVGPAGAPGTQRPLALSYIDPDGIGPITLLPLDRGADAFAGALVGARFAEDAPCDQAVVAFTGDPKVRVFPLCRPAAGKKTQPNAPGPGQVPAADIGLPGDYVLGASGALELDFDRDGHLDLVLDGIRPNTKDHRVLVAFGLGDGRFHSASFKGQAPPATPDQHAGETPPLDCAGRTSSDFPLALAHLTDGDDAIDFVGMGGVCYRTPKGEMLLDLGTNDLSSAVIADVNGNGLPDVVVATSTTLEVLSGTGTYAHRFTYPMTAKTQQLVAGDYDGDLVDDVVYRLDGGNGPSTLGVLFGRALAAPEPPVTIGAVDRPVQMLSGAVNPLGAEPDELTDIGIVNQPDPANPNLLTVALIRGSTDRQLEAPFAIGTFIEGQQTAQNGARHAFAVALGSGRFAHSTGDALAVLGVQAALADGTPSTDDARLWLVPFSDSAQVTERAVTRPSSDGIAAHVYQWGNARLAPANLVGGGADRQRLQQLVIAVPSATAASDGSLWVARAENDAFSIGPAISIGNGSDRRPFELAVADFDRDGVDDVAVRSVRASLNQVLVFFGDGHGGLAQPPVSVEVRGDQLVSVAAARLHGGPTLLVAQDQTVLAVPFVGRVPKAGVPLLHADSAVHALAGADFDGDGVDDIAIAKHDGIDVYFGVPENAR